jgi:alpha 1,6-mannosyltransferase
MLTLRKLVFLITAIFCITIFLKTSITYSSSSSSNPAALLRKLHKPNPQDDAATAEADEARRAELELILESANRPLRHADEFPSLREHLEYLFPYEGPASTKFPAYIWQTWKYTPASREFDERFRITEASWTERHPGYVHEVR